MVLRIFLIAVMFLLIFCSVPERDNPEDKGSINYHGNQIFSSSSVTYSYSSAEVSSSSSMPSSSSIAASSSSVIVSSSSVVVPSSSSIAASSSSVIVSSSSVVVPSSSSIAASSSSVIVSSSSVVVPSSSSSICTANNNTNTLYCSNGTMKTYGFVIYEGQTYKTVEIGTQTWMAENLNYNVIGSKCGDGSSLNEICNTYGRLYNWATAMALPSKCNNELSTSDADCAIKTPHQGICPSDWHIPSYDEWNVLMSAVGGVGTAGKYLKAVNGWIGNGNGEDKFGFSALPGGYGSNGYFGHDGYYGYWWSAIESSSNRAYSTRMDYNYGAVSYGSYDRSDWYSVRCLRN